MRQLNMISMQSIHHQHLQQHQHHVCHPQPGRTTDTPRQAPLAPRSRGEEGGGELAQAGGGGGEDGIDLDGAGGR